MLKKNITGYIIITVVLVLFTFLGWQIRGEYEKGKIQKEQDQSASGYDSSRKTFPIVGTGINYNDGIVASSTISTEVLQTIYSFASSTNEAYWDTANNWPNLYGATSTIRFLNNKADLITINGLFKGVETASSFTYEIAGSNDPLCNSASSTQNMGVNWYPVNATTTEETSILLGEDGTHTVSPGSTATTTFAFSLEDINYDCTRIKFYNSSTTDESLLYVEATLKEIN